MNNIKTEDELEELEIDLLLEGVLRRYGYDFRSYKSSVVRQRIRAAMLRGRIATISGFQDAVLRNTSVFNRFLESFSDRSQPMFAEPAFYHAFRVRVLPLLKTYPVVRMWHPECSTGQEVYSMAILLEEEGIYSRSRIYATGLSGQTVSRARLGSFPLSAVDEYSANYLHSGGRRTLLDYLETSGDRMLIHSDLKRNVVFSEHNLATDGSINEFQVIMFRDILNRFNGILRFRIDTLIYESLGHLGFLALGAEESLDSMPHSACYTAVDDRAAIYQKTGLVRGLGHLHPRVQTMGRAER